MPKTLKRGDTHPPITGTISDEDGPVPLGAADEVLLILRSTDHVAEFVAEVIDADAVRGDEDAGKWIYAWQPGDTDIPGRYAAEVQVTWEAGVIETFPNDAANNETVTIDPDLNPPED